MKIKTTKSTTPYYCYGYYLFYDHDGNFCEYRESVNSVIKHKHRRAYYYIINGQKIYYKDLYVMYKLYNNMNVMITKSVLSVCVDI